MRLWFVAVAFAATLVMGAGGGRAGEEKVLNVYNWSDYVAPDTLEKFTAETGIKVNYDVYDKNELLAAKLMAGRSGYDVVFPSASPHFAQQVKAGLYRKLDRAKLRNFGNVDKDVLATLAAGDPGNQYGVPYMISATGFGYNVDMIKKAMPDAPTDSWAMLFDPKVVAKFKACGVSLLDDPVEVVPAVLSYLGKTGTSQTNEDLKAASDAVTAARPSLRYFHSSKYINDLANGDTCLAHGYVGDLVQARNRAKEAKKGVNIAIAIPKEGAVVNIDVMAVPADAPHPDNAHAFIDFLMRPEIIAAVTNTTGYANAIVPAAPHVDAEIRNDPVIYPPAAVRAREFTVAPAEREYEHARTRAWTKVKTGK